MSTTVQRLPADKPGDDIVSAVLTSTESQLERGSYEVNTEDRDRRTVAVDVFDSEFIQPGGLHTIDNRGALKNGLLTNFSYKYESTKAKATIAMSLETIA